MVELIPQDRLYLDDLYVGQRFASATDTIDEAQIKAFAARFDPQPFHIDEKAAEDTLFKGLAASWWHTAAITMLSMSRAACPWRAES
jgi:acyl dehydratase